MSLYFIRIDYKNQDKDNNFAQVASSFDKTEEALEKEKKVILKKMLDIQLDSL